MSTTPEEVNLPHFDKDNKVWIETGKHSEAMWQQATVVEQTGVFVLCMTESGRALNLDLRDDSVFPVNPSSQPDMTGLYFINEPGILFNLEDRSLNDLPYTFMGNVLVAVNPLKRIKDPVIPAPRPLTEPHPYTVAQNAFAQLRFAFDNHQLDINQSVVTSGESGAGKTECCKMVLKFLVESSLQKGSGVGVEGIDQKLLESNHITESFGNAQTLRNHNSSRFGKFMKLHFEKRAKEKEFAILGASIETYLLERSRVSFHNQGERNYHIFYQLLEGVSLLKSSKEMKASFDKALKTKLKFRLLTAHESDKIASRGKDDKKAFQSVLAAMASLNFDEEKKKEIFEILAGILHLGNFVFIEKLLNNTETAVLDEGIYGAYDVVKFASEFLGIDRELLLSLVTKEELVIRRQKVTKIFDAFKANYTRDALCKSLYSHLFNFVISQIDEALTIEKRGQDDDERPFIGILDIFGFESFKRNDFEQLLINFANEALQATFNRSVFENEAELYKRERLILDSSDLIKAPSNSACMNLFIGVNSPKGKKETMQDVAKRRGLLLAIDDESQNLEPSDKKMLANLNRMFGKHQDWKRPHPKLRQEIFIIRHFAGEVKYSIGYFLEKNRDELPKSVISVFSQSSKSILKAAFSKQKGNDTKSKTIIKKFKTQITDLVSTLEQTKCSFIRCVKPNEEMKRGKAPSWFNRRYISHQLRNLSIPQTAEVLQNGFPTRLTYKSLMESYLKLIPDKALKGWKNLIAKKKESTSQSNFPEASFVKSLLFAFEVDSKSYKLGLTMVFFKSGELAKLDKILKSAANFESFKDKERVIKRFVYYFVRLRWREVYAKVLAFNRFREILEIVRERERIRKEQERLRKERLEKERLERERMEREEQDKLEQLEKQRQEEEERIKQQLEEERIRREKKIEVEETEENKKIADLFDEVEHQAEEKVKEKFKTRGLSVTSVEMDEATKAAMNELKTSVAKMEAQSRMEENIRNFYTDLVNNSQQFWSQAAENIKESLKGWGDFFRRVSETETYQKVQKRHQERMKVLKRTIKVTNRLLLRVARKSEWFQKAENRLNKIQDRIAREFEKERLREEGLEVEDDSNVNRIKLENPPPISRNKRKKGRRASAKSHRSSIKSFSRIGAGARIRGFLTVDRKEAQTGKMSAMEHIEKVKEMIDQGIIPPSALGDLATVMERGAKAKKTLVVGQHQPKNSDASDGLEDAVLDSGFPDVNPSNDNSNKWCPVPLAYENGFFYVCVTPTVTRTKKISLLCGWEHSDSKKKKRLFSHWDCDLSVLSLGMIYDTLISSKDATIRQLVKAGGGDVPMFPGWKQDIYEKAVSKRKPSKGGKFFFSPSNMKTRRERMRFLASCIDEDFALSDPALLGLWIAQIFGKFSKVDSTTGNAELLELPLVLEMFDVDTYGGVANL